MIWHCSNVCKNPRAPNLRFQFSEAFIIIGLLSKSLGLQSNVSLKYERKILAVCLKFDNNKYLLKYVHAHSS